MYYDVLVEQVENNEYMAKVLAWSDFVVQAPTRKEVLKLAQMRIVERIKKAELFRIEVPSDAVSPWLAFAGMYANNPLFSEVAAEIIKSREALDEIAT